VTVNVDNVEVCSKVFVVPQSVTSG
jgi:hypothetical protein